MQFYGYFINQGVDIVNLNRAEFNNEKLLKRFLTSNEYKEYLLINNVRLKKEFIASRWAAKEAIIKALDRRLLMHHIEIYNNRDQPCCNFQNYLISLSISHETNYVVATALVVLAN